MLFLEQRIKTILEELKCEIYPETVPVESYKFKMTQEQGIEKIDPCDLNWETFSIDGIWGGHRKYFWFVTEVVIPPSFDGKCVTYHLSTGSESAWDATNSQFRIYINGIISQGLDVNHRSMILTENAKANEKYRISLYAFTGDNNDHLVLKSGLSVLDRKTEKLYYDLAVPHDVAMLLEKDDKTHIDIIACLNEAINILDLRIPFSDEYYTSIDKAEDFITSEFYDKKCGRSDAEVWCVGHTHIDIAWLWTLSVTRDKAYRNFATALELMREYPEYVFMSSQPQLYKFVKEQSPALFEEIRERVKEGRWEAEGGMFLEADCNIASGESLVRQILYGKAFFKKEFNVDNKVLWLPDVFGYSAALPQIMKKSGMEYFMTTKINWNDTDKLPYDTFNWRGIDGSEVLCHFITATDYAPDSKKFYTTYNGTLNASQIKGSWHRYQQKDLNNKVLMSFGFGDGGGGPTRDMLENYRRLKKGIPGCPKTVMATSRQYFEKLEAEIRDSKYVPKWSGELYLEYHRGTYTSMARNKKYNRKSEIMAQNVELISVMANTLLGSRYPQKEICDAWEVILRNQFHDILPGSSIKEVYEDSKEEYEKILAAGSGLINSRCEKIAANINCSKDSIVVFNPLGFECSDIVSFDVPSQIANPCIFETGGDGSEKEICCQRIDAGKAVFVAPDVPAKGYKTFMLREGKEKELCNKLKISRNGFSNRFFDVKLDNMGQFDLVYDKLANRQVLKPGEKGNVLTAYEDKPFEYDAWNIEMYYSEKSWAVDDVYSIEVTESGPVRGCLRITRKFLNSTIVQSVYIYMDLARIDIRNNIDWKEKQILLRASFSVDIHAEEATYDIQYGNVKRPTHRNTSWDMARFEVCAHKWADCSEDDYGFSLLNDCKYGYATHDGVMSISLLKSPIYPNPLADKEKHEFVYSLFPHTGDWKSAGTVQQAYAINNPLYACVKREGKGTLPQNYSLINCSAENVIIEVVKKAEQSDDLIIRMYECYNRRTNVKVACAANLSMVEECDLLESRTGSVDVEGSTFSFQIKPYEIKTFKIKY